MADEVDVVYLDDKILWKLKEKLDRHSPENDRNVKHHKTRSKRAPKFEVYKPGVTRLSNRSPSVAATESPVPNLNNDERKTTDGRTYTNDQDTRKDVNLKNNSTYDRSDKKPQKSRPRQRNKGNRRMSSDEVEVIHDEMEWDNFGEGDLIHCSPWKIDSECDSSTRSTKSNSEECASCSSPLYRQHKHSGEKHKKHGRYPSIHSDKSSEHNRVRTASAASSDCSYTKSRSNYEHLEDCWSDGSAKKQRSRKKKHGNERRSNATDEDSLEEIENDNLKEGHKLFDPSNPDQPIFVKNQVGGERNAGDYFVPHGANTYSSTDARDRLLEHANIPRRHSAKQSSHYDGKRMNNYDDEPPLPTHVRNSQLKSFRSTMQEVDKCEMAMSNMLSNPSFDSDEFVDGLTRVRNKLKSLYEGMIIADIESSTQNHIEQALWKNVFYQVIEILREHIRNCAEDQGNEAKGYLVLLLDQARAFYENLLDNLQRNHQFNLKDVLQNPIIRKKYNTKGGKRMKLVFLSCQRTFISLGDIARYREQVLGSTNYGQSRHSYLQAQLLAPKNGRPYNQLAILAVKTRNKLDAVYYYVRSLCASNPILTARESLMALFDEIRRKFEYIEKKNEDKKLSSKVESISLNDVERKQNRREVWILPGDKPIPRAPVPPVQSPEPDVDISMPISELMKHFILLFLNLHGKQFTRVGLENYDELLAKLLKIFRVCLEKFSIHRLLQIFTINMFSVSNANNNSIHGSERDAKYNMNRALDLFFSMLSIVVQYSIDLLKDLKTTSVTFKFESNDKHATDKLTTVHAVLKVALDWMYCNKSLWFNRVISYRCSTTYSSASENDLWSSLCELADWVCESSRVFPVLVYSEYGSDLEEVFLPEDTYLAGFTYILQTFSDDKFIDMKNELDKVENKTNIHICIRLDIIRDFLDYLCGMDKPVLAFKEGRYIVMRYSARMSSSSDQDVYHESFLYDFDSEEEVLEDVDDASLQEAKEDDSGNINQLKMYRDSLREASKKVEERKDQIEKSLSQSHLGFMTYEIKPRKLVPDTNCFIDHLEEIKRIMKTKEYFISVPLVVIKELEGLGSNVKSSSAHAKQVFENAKLAVSFIDEMVSKSSLLCPLTSNGTELHTLQFLSEEIDSIGSNDDFILRSAESLVAKIDGNKLVSKTSNDKCIRRTVVLLTEDRNLRLKSVMHDVPSKSIREFCKWAKI